MKKLEILSKPKFYLLKLYLSSYISTLVIFQSMILFVYILNLLIFPNIPDINNLVNDILFWFILLYMFLPFLIISKNTSQYNFMLKILKIYDYYYFEKSKSKENNDNSLNIQFDPTNRNVLILKQNNKLNYIAIPSGVNRTDIITNKELIDGYNYNADVIIIINDSITRKVYYNNKLQLTQSL